MRAWCVIFCSFGSNMELEHISHSGGGQRYSLRNGRTRRAHRCSEQHRQLASAVRVTQLRHADANKGDANTTSHWVCITELQHANVNAAYANADSHWVSLYHAIMMTWKVWWICCHRGCYAVTGFQKHERPSQPTQTQECCGCKRSDVKPACSTRTALEWQATSISNWSKHLLTFDSLEWDDEPLPGLTYEMCLLWYRA